MRSWEDAVKLQLLVSHFFGLRVELELNSVYRVLN